MQYTIQDLQDEKRFSLVLHLSLDDIVPFVFRHIRILNAATSLFYAATACSFISMIFIFFNTVLPGEWGWGKILLHCFTGFILWPVLLIPLHELIHALMYRMAGAPKIRFGIYPGYYLFYVTADRYVIGRNRFLLVASGPFLLISVLLIAGIGYIPFPGSWSLVICLFVHTTMCIGDFALAGFFLENRKDEIFTYDDTEGKISCFYKKVVEPDNREGV